MEKIITAFATDDGLSFIGRHFGDADFYDVYEISEKQAAFLKRIDNSTDEDENEEGHGDANKAQGVTGLLRKEGVTMSVSRFFGPNLKRIKKKFLCVLVREGSIKESIGKLQDNFPVLMKEWSKGEERNFITL